jgi:chromosome segregation ATPase
LNELETKLAVLEGLDVFCLCKESAMKWFKTRKVTVRPTVVDNNEARVKELEDRVAKIEKTLGELKNEDSEISFDLDQVKADAQEDLKNIIAIVENLKTAVQALHDSDKSLNERLDRVSNLATSTASMSCSKDELLALVKTLSNALTLYHDKANLPF